MLHLRDETEPISTPFTSHSLTLIKSFTHLTELQINPFRLSFSPESESSFIDLMSAWENMEVLKLVPPESMMIMNVFVMEEWFGIFTGEDDTGFGSGGDGGDG